ncbi:MAG: hypothetical protein IJ694_00510 [Acidaminococcaceae bacterium]|nr:hypothetical protein [Acidaminococcaceae bacterium]
MLEKVQGLKGMLQDGEIPDCDAMAAVLCRELICSVYVLDGAGAVLGYALQDGQECGLLRAKALFRRRFPRKMKKLFGNAEGMACIRHHEFVCPFQENVLCAYPERHTVVVPMGCFGKGTGTLLLIRNDGGFCEEELLLAEYAAVTVGYRLEMELQVSRLKQSGKMMMVQSGLSTLSYSEWQGIVCLLQELNGMEGTVVVDKIAKQTGASRMAILNALRKLASAGLLQTNSMGSKGIHIKIKNEFLLEEIRNRSRNA